MFRLLAKLGFLILIALAALGVWRAYTYSPVSQSYAPFILATLIVAVLMAGALVRRSRRS
ncbi:MAG TPA: hypothetical protein VEL69_04845 [Ktedonobacteraceae bacterium]|nr:hypothetical protein [Ktedonobacteraceae bacterium]